MAKEKASYARRANFPSAYNELSLAGRQPGSFFKLKFVKYPFSHNIIV